jgi:hypothetical protein
VSLLTDDVISLSFTGRVLLAKGSPLFEVHCMLIYCCFLVQLITGYLIPNNAQAFILATSLGSWAIDGYVY